jgi:hypothetical protein
MPQNKLISSARRLLGRETAAEAKSSLLVEADPHKNRFRRPKYPNLSRIQATADVQARSPFFRLPLEIREHIYLILWRDTGLVQHIYVARSGYTHARCTTEHNAPDDRQTEIERLYGAEIERYGDYDSELWNRRLTSGWGIHWRCEERAAAMRNRGVDPFLPLLLTSKRSYATCTNTIAFH